MSFSSSALIACGYEKKLLWKQLVLLSISCFILFLTKLDLTQLCYGLIIIALIDYILTGLLLKYLLGLSSIEFIQAHIKNIIISVIVGIVACIIDLFIDLESTTLGYSIIILMATMPIMWLGSIFIVKHPLVYEIRILYKSILELKFNS